MSSLTLAQVGEGLVDGARHHVVEVVGVPVLPEHGDGVERDIALHVSGEAADIIALTEGNLGRLITLYRNSDTFVDSGIKTEVEARLKQKLAELKQELDGGQRIVDEVHRYFQGELLITDNPLLYQLLALEGDPINADKCVTDVLYAACKDWNAAMWLWEQFTSPFDRRRSVDARSDEFLRKHLDTYGGDVGKLRALYGKLNRGSRRAMAIDAYIAEISSR